MEKIQKQVLSVGITVGIALAFLWALYRSEFSYPNTEDGRLAALSEYILKKEENSVSGISEDDVIWEIANWEGDGSLLVAFAEDNASNVHGILHLERGPFGNYRPINAQYGPFPYRAGAYAENIWLKGRKEDFLAVVGEGCQEISAIEADFQIYDEAGIEWRTETIVWPVTEPEFLWLFTQKELHSAMKLDAMEHVGQTAWQLRFLDENGTDITEQYIDTSVSSNWSSGIGSAELQKIYVLMGLVIVIASVIGRFFWLRYKK